MQWLVICLLMTLAGCVPVPPQPHSIPPQRTTVALSRAADPVYQCAVTTFAKLPTAVVRAADPTARAFGGELHHAVNFSVVVEAQPNGSLVTIAGHIPPMRQTTGEFTEVQDYGRLLQERC